MKLTTPVNRIAIILLLLLFAVLPRVYGFSLMGPYPPWMKESNGYRQASDIGGVVDIGEEYRWNVPVLTYAFDQSFIDYFGANGVAAVEQAIQILNDLPPASEMVLSNYPTTSWFHGTYGTNLIVDVKLATLVVLLEQLGLTDPQRYAFTIEKTDGFFWQTVTNNHGAGYYLQQYCPEYIGHHNFDPETFLPSESVNDELYEFVVLNLAPESGYVYPITVDDSIVGVAPSVASFMSAPLEEYVFSTDTLSRDEIGGLQFLLSSNNVNFETVIAGVRGAETNATNWVNGAWRPGVEKITFIRLDYDSTQHTVVPFTNQFVDTYVSNGIAVQQQLERVISQPDILFTVSDPGPWQKQFPDETMKTWISRTDTSHWLKLAAENGDAGKNGPGLIQPPVQLIYKRRGTAIFSNDAYNGTGYYTWGSYAGKALAPILYPDGNYAREQMVTELELSGAQTDSSGPLMFRWQAPIPRGGLAAFQISSNLLNWTTIATVTNSGATFSWWHDGLNQQSRFFRMIPQ